MAAMKFENSFRDVPARLVSGSPAVSIVVAIIVIMSIIMITLPPGTA